MQRTKKAIGLLLVSLLILGFGLLCLNYTVVGKAEHHREWAEAHSMPVPSETIFVTGVAATVVSAGFAGFLFGRPRAK